MSSFFEWKNAYIIGNETIDSQHKSLLELGILLEKCISEHSNFKKDKYRRNLEDILSDLVQYTEHHFRSEEEIMLLHGHKNLSAHQKTHQLLVSKVLSIQEKCHTTDDVNALEHELSSLLSSWLTDHIINHDLPLKELFK